MKILFLSRFFYPHIGGVEKHVFEISKKLIQKGHKVIIVAEKHQKNLKDKELINDINIYRIPIGESERLKKFEIWLWLFFHLNLIRQADIVHAHDVFFWYFPFRFIFPNKKVFTTFHGYESFPVSKKAIIVRKISERLSFGNICIGDFMQKWYGTKPTFVSYGGVDTKNQKLDKNNSLSAVFVGRLDEQTGFLTYLEAVKKIREKFSDFKFTVFGDGKFRSKISKDIDFRGFVKDAEKAISKYNFIFVSRYLSILEAMAAKRLVFAVYDNPLKKDYLGMTPFSRYITIVNSANKAAEKVMYFLRNPDEKKNMIEKGFNWVKNQSWENLTNTYIELWNFSL